MKYLVIQQGNITGFFVSKCEIINHGDNHSLVETPQLSANVWAENKLIHDSIDGVCEFIKKQYEAVT